MKKKSPDERAKDLHNKITDEFKKRMITIAVGNTDTDLSVVGTSEKYLQNEVLDAMEENEILATPRYGTHAEEDIVEEANKRNINVTEIGASRSICLDCEKLLKANKIESKTEYSSKKSRKRQK